MGEVRRLEEDEEEELVRVWENARGRLLFTDVANESLLEIELIMARKKRVRRMIRVALAFVVCR